MPRFKQAAAINITYLLPLSIPINMASDQPESDIRNSEQQSLEHGVTFYDFPPSYSN